MARIVYIRQIRDHTFLHFSYTGEAFRLRDYSVSAHIPPEVVERQRPGGHTATTIRALASQPGNHLLNAPKHDLEDCQFWHDQIIDLNQQHLPLGGPGPIVGPIDGPAQPSVVEPPRQRLLDRFQREVSPFIEKGDGSGLKDTLAAWVEKLSAIETKNDMFNHWCQDDALHLWNTGSGIGWTASLLEYSRRDYHMNFVETSCESLDFALLSMDLNLGISATRNLFKPGYEDFIKPDGLAVRRDGSVAVLEVKGPQDEAGLTRGILQGFCGLLAVYAKREMLTRVAHTPAIRRPAFPNFLFRSMSLRWRSISLFPT